MQVKKICQYCGKQFLVIPYRATRAKFCGNACRYDARIGTKHSQETRNKISVSHKGKIHPYQVYPKQTVVCKNCSIKFMALRPNRPRKFCSGTCRAIYTMAHSKKSGTSIENTIERKLIENEINFVKQKAIGRIAVVDFLVKGEIAVQCDGDYWHSSIKQTMKDLLQNVALNKMGYKVIRLWERDIKSEPDKCIETITEAIQS